MEPKSLYDQTIWDALNDDVLYETDGKVRVIYNQWELRMRDRLTFLKRHKPGHDECIRNLELLIDMHDWHSTYKKKFQSSSNEWIEFLFRDEWLRTPPELIRHPFILENIEEWCIWNGWWGNDSEGKLTFLYPSKEI